MTTSYAVQWRIQGPGLSCNNCPGQKLYRAKIIPGGTLLAGTARYNFGSQKCTDLPKVSGIVRNSYFICVHFYLEIDVQYKMNRSATLLLYALHYDQINLVDLHSYGSEKYCPR